jgi:hypothetical protein
LNVQNIEENMQNTRFLNRLVGLDVAAAILLVVALVVFAGSALETASSSINSVVQLTRQPHLLLRQPNPPANSAHSQPTNQVRLSAAYDPGWRPEWRQLFG